MSEGIKSDREQMLAEISAGLDANTTEMNVTIDTNQAEMRSTVGENGV
jgi:hypothetical protein